MPTLILQPRNPIWPLKETHLELPVAKGTATTTEETIFQIGTLNLVPLDLLYTLIGRLEQHMTTLPRY